MCGKIGDSVCEPCQKRLEKCCKNYNTWQKELVGACRDDASELSELVKQYKYYSVFSLARPLSEIFANYLPDAENIILVPAPTAPKHIRQRGLDHTTKLARHIAKIKGWEYQNLISRTSNSRQVGKDSKTRQKQARNSYEINPKIAIDPNKTYLIIDDITTTGATLKACKTILKNSGAKNIHTAVLIKS